MFTYLKQTFAQESSVPLAMRATFLWTINAYSKTKNK